MDWRKWNCLDLQEMGAYATVAEELNWDGTEKEDITTQTIPSSLLSITKQLGRAIVL